MGLLVSGRNPAASKTAERSYFTATAGQTVFTIAGGYQAGDIDVFLNGVRLVESDDFTATNGSTVVLSSAASLGDHLAVVCYYQFQATGHWTKSESDGRYLTAAGTNPMSAYLKTPNYGITSASDSSSASIEANAIGGTQGVGVKAWGRNVATFGGDIHYITDTRGAGGAHRFYGWNGSSWTENAKIDSLGRVTKPNQPAFRVGNSTNYTPGSNGNILFNDTAGFHFVRDNAYSTSTGLYTAPVSGLYYFFTSVIFGNVPSGTDMSDCILLRKNGVNFTYSSRRASYVAGSTGTSGYFVDTAFSTVQLSYGDSVGVYNQRGTYLVHGNTNYTYFGGWLIG